MEEKVTGSSRGSIEAWFLALAFWLLPAAALALGARGWLPPLGSEHGAGIDRMIFYLFLTVGTLFVLGHLALGYFICRFGRQGRVTFRLPSSKAEKAWSLIPVVIMAVLAEGGVLVLGLPVWGKFYGTAPPHEALPVEVTCQQFEWTIRYPGRDGIFGRTHPELITPDNRLGRDEKDPASRDDLILVNQLYLPVDRPVSIRLRSKDVLHSFFLPNLRVKQDIVPGMSIGIWFVPTETGKYEIACAELCGLGHYRMRGFLHVLSQAEFQEWFKRQGES